MEKVDIPQCIPLQTFQNSQLQANCITSKNICFLTQVWFELRLGKILKWYSQDFDTDSPQFLFVISQNLSYRKVRIWW